MKPANKFAVPYKDSAELIPQNPAKRRNREFILRFLAFLLLSLLPTFALSPLDQENNPKFNELFRIKVWNQAGGTIEVSTDEGKSYLYVGTVVYPTVKTNPESYAASRWVGDGRVAATAVNAIHLKTATEAKTGSGVVFSLLPKEFLKPPSRYRSYLSPDSSIYTDIPAGEAIFGGAFSPFVGNVVKLSRPGSALVPLPPGYVPQLNDKLYIMVDRPVDYPKEIILENKFGGKVTVNYFTGGEKVIGEVLRPVIGVGRFDGTKYASVGRLRANHAGVIDVCTSRLGKIGGFQIVPSIHGQTMKSVRELTQWMVVGPAEVGGVSLEGQAPLFKYFLRPVYGENDLLADDWEKRLLDRSLVEVKLKGKNNWQPMPVEEFDDYDLTGEVPAWANSALSNVTHLRILFPIEP